MVPSSGSSYDDAVLFEKEEIESFVEIVKNYASSERKAAKKLIVIEQTLTWKQAPEYKIKVTQFYYNKIEENLKRRLINLLIVID